jgi:hypothetical protein
VKNCKNTMRHTPEHPHCRGIAAQPAAAAGMPAREA